MRLLEDYPLARLRMAIEKALRLQAPGREAILQFLTPRFSWRNTTFLLDGRRHLRLIKVGKPDLSAYGTLLPKEEIR